MSSQVLVSESQATMQGAPDSKHRKHSAGAALQFLYVTPEK
jgi:hypothetical protein